MCVLKKFSVKISLDQTIKLFPSKQAKTPFLYTFFMKLFKQYRDTSAQMLAYDEDIHFMKTFYSVMTMSERLAEKRRMIFVQIAQTTFLYSR